MTLALDTDQWTRRQSRAQRQAIEDAADLRAMRAGPKLDGTILIVPGGRRWYKREAARFWSSVGFRWDPDAMQWTRDVTRPLEGKRYAPDVWLERTRIKFFAFYPELEQLDLWTA